MASSLITSWQIEEENVEAVTHFLFLGSKITADGDCSHAIRRQFLPSRKSMTNLDSALKSKHYFADRGPYSQGYGLSSSHVQLWELDHKESRCWIIEAFELWCRRLLRVPWTERRSNQSILKEINLEYSLEIVMLKLKLQYFGHVMQIASSLKKTLMLGKIEGRRRREQQRMIWLGGVTEAMDMNLGKLQEMVRDREA